MDNKQGALTVMEAMVLEYPENEQFCGFSANLNAILNNFDKAAFYYKKLYAISPSEPIAQAIIQNYLKADKPEQALACVKYLSQVQQGPVESVLMQIMSDKQMLKKQPGDQQILARITAEYKTMGINELPLSSKK